MSQNLNPDKALIFRIVHIRNVPWILEQGGLFARSSSQQDANYVNIGSPELIAKRRQRHIPISPGGTLSDYVPFYFTPFSIMMYNIKTGYQGVTCRPNEEIVICISSQHRIVELNLPFVFTNGHALMVEADFYNNLADLVRSIGSCSKVRTSNAIQMIFTNNFAIRPRLWCTTMCRSMPCEPWFALMIQAAQS